MELKVFICSVLTALSILVFQSNCYEEKEGTMRVELYRKPSARHQYLKYGSTLKKYGTNYDQWLGDGYNYRMNRTNDSIALYKYLDNEFYGEIVVGKPGQKMYVAFDTAWSISWVMSKKCTRVPTPGCANHNLYDHDKSSSWKVNGKPYVANEGDFNFTGFYSYDNVSIAHSNVTNYLFVEMVGIPDFMSLHKSDGIFGLGIKHDDYEPFFYTMYRQKKIKDPIFSIYLNRDRQSKRGGNVLLGFIDKSHIHKTQYKNKTVIPDEIKYLPVTSNQFWQFEVDKIVVVPDHPPHTDNVTLCENGCSAISNTGSNEIVGPPNDIDQIHDLIDARLYNGSWVVSCDTVNKLPKIDFVLGGQYFRLGGDNYIIKITSGYSTMCISAFNSYQTDKDMWILGGAFLSQYYSIYNIEDKTIGFVRVP